MSPSDSLKAYIGYFQNQLAKIQNCSDDVSALAFISGPRVTHMMYKHLVKYNITSWSEALYGAQSYIQLEEAMKSFANSSFNCGDDGAKLKPQHGDPFVDNQGGRQGALKKRSFSNSQQSSFRAYRMDDNITPLKLPI